MIAATVMPATPTRNVLAVPRISATTADDATLHQQCSYDAIWYVRISGPWSYAAARKCVANINDYKLSTAALDIVGVAIYRRGTYVTINLDNHTFQPHRIADHA